MRYNKLDLNLLVALDHLLHQRSVSAAAERMNMTQSAMSNALMRLRAYFDDDLLVKVGRRLELTPRAEALKDPVRDVLVRVDWTIATQPQFDAAQSDRTFNLLVSDYSLATLIPELLHRCRLESSGVRFNFQHQVAGPERLLERGDLDVLIVPLDFCARRHPSEVVLEETFCVIARNDGPFAKGKLTRKQFIEASHIGMVPAGALSLESVYFQQLGIERRIDVATHSFTTIPALVARTDCIATVHTRLARQAQRAFPITILDLPFRLPRMRQAMQWYKYRSQDAGLIWLRRLIREAGAAI